MTFPVLSIQTRATLFAHLAAMEKAGLSPEHAFSLLKLPGKDQPRVQATRKLLLRGQDVASAAAKSGLFTDLETKLVRAACNAGSPQLSYSRLATRYALKARQSSQIKSRLSMPLLVLLMALLVQPLPALVAGSISGSMYLFSVIRPFVILIGLVALFRFVAVRLTQTTNPPSAIQINLSRALIQFPLLGTMWVRRNRRDFYENLALLTEAGIPMQDAVKLAQQTVSLCVVRTDFGQLTTRLLQGDSLTQAVAHLHYQRQFAGNYSEHSFVQTGEASGTLPEMLLRFADGESAALAQQQAQLAEWLPRLFYLGVCGWMAYQILQQKII